MIRPTCHSSSSSYLRNESVVVGVLTNEVGLSEDLLPEPEVLAVNLRLCRRAWSVLSSSLFFTRMSDHRIMRQKPGSDESLYGLWGEMTVASRSGDDSVVRAKYASWTWLRYMTVHCSWCRTLARNAWLTHPSTPLRPFSTSATRKSISHSEPGTRYDPFNALVAVAHSQPSTSSGTLSDVAVAIKDNICTSNMPTTCASAMAVSEQTTNPRMMRPSWISSAEMVRTS